MVSGSLPDIILVAFISKNPDPGAKQFGNYIAEFKVKSDSALEMI